MSRWFSTDPSFCPYCGTILPLPVDSGNVICKLCDYQQDASTYEGMEEYSSIKFAVRKQKLAITDKGDGPMVERRCLKCGHDQMTYTTQQTRGADEGQTVFYTCPKCKFKETENS
ncbi:DNA-directed RNA polymerase I subunit RPA12-like [Halichondria panicea]|uniref:DNA-directed RNA polymerase I subunit RPA12-like n=1 Tax=Halichondria panicea TaxID=6063 RepID=UPI00312B599C